MKEILQFCPLCKNGQLKHFETVIFHDLKIENQICSHCGFVFQNPRMSGQQLSDFYNQSYRELYQGQANPTERDLHIQRERSGHLLKILKGNVHLVSRHLDIGSSAGVLLKTVEAYYNCSSVGVEPGDAYRKFARDFDIDVYSSLQKIRDDNLGPFDLISMVHVLEHIPDPVSYLSELRELYLDQDGYLLLEVPNLFFHDSFEIAHMSAFSKHSLSQTLMKSGYSIVESIAHGLPRSKLIPLYLTILAKPVKNATQNKVKPELWVKNKRKLGFFYRRIVQKIFPNRSWLPVNHKDSGMEKDEKSYK